ncbi:purine-nucleoside phosphorylase [bacterium]|nr:purine-nucleoside phosphorylase [bacterium]
MKPSKTAAAAAFIRTLFPEFPFRTALILGSGLGSVAGVLEKSRETDVSDIPGWPAPSVSGHRGKLIRGYIGNAPVTVLQGRIHFYEGHPLQTVIFPVAVLADLGVGTIILTNAAGGISPDLEPGDIMMVSDHLNLLMTNPLIGPNDDAAGPRFPDMSEPYDPELRRLAEDAAPGAGIVLKEGVLAATTGPSYETAAEVKMIGKLGGDAVCMSTVPEVIAAVHRGMRVLAFSCITNKATGLHNTRLSHADVKESAARIQTRFTPFMKSVIEKIDRTIT